MKLNNENKAASKSNDMKPITLIHSFEAPAGQEEKFLNAWTAVHHYMQKQKGFMEADLQRLLNQEDLTKFNFINIALWENLEAFRVAVSNDKFILLAKHVLGFSCGYELYTKI